MLALAGEVPFLASHKFSVLVLELALSCRLQSGASFQAERLETAAKWAGGTLRLLDVLNV